MTDSNLSERFKAVLDQEVLNAPPAPQIDTIVERCAHDLYRRRLTLTAIGLVIAAAAAVPVVSSFTGNGRHEQAASALPSTLRLTDTQVLAACKEGNQGPHLTALMYDSGPPTVQAQGTSAQVTETILTSHDGRYWAQCTINRSTGADVSAAMSVNTTTDTTTDIGDSEGLTCNDPDGPPAPPCDTFFVTYVNRVLGPVAAIQFTTADGKTTTADTKNGYALFTYTGLVPVGYSHTRLNYRKPFLTRVTYLNSHGDPIAAQNLGTSNPSTMTVGTLPLLKTYPSQRTGPVGIDYSGRGLSRPAKGPQNPTTSN